MTRTSPKKHFSHFLWITLLTCLVLLPLTIWYGQATNVLGATTSVPSSRREYHIYLGQGEANSEEWVDIPGAHAYVDSAKYGTISSVSFDATLRVPTGNQKVYVRLYNATDKHPVWYSELSMEGVGPTLLSSSKLTLSSGSKLYQVQIKTQLKFTTFLDSARIRITGS